MRLEDIKIYTKSEDTQGYLFFDNHTGRILVWCEEIPHALDGIATYGMAWISGSTNSPLVWMELFPPGSDEHMQDCIDSTHEYFASAYKAVKSLTMELER